MLEEQVWLQKSEKSSDDSESWHCFCTGHSDIPAFFSTFAALYLNLPTNALMKSREKVLVIGALGQLGSELTPALAESFGQDQVVAAGLTDHAEPNGFGTYLKLDVTDANALAEAVRRHGITHIYHLAAILSAKGEKDPQAAWNVNMAGLLNVLEVSRACGVRQVFWPSTIAVFGVNTPSVNTPQFTVKEPSTVYGISKLAGELWCQYYFEKYQLDVRSIRYPGLIGWKALPGGGTTDYAVDIYHKAIGGQHFECFLHEQTALPMMYMPDAIRATLELMAAPAEAIRTRTSYNLHGMSFTPAEIAAEVKRHYPNFTISYRPDFRQQIADSWPKSIDDSVAKEEWGWQPQYDLRRMTEDMLANLARVRV